jgi:arylsulfatase/arylsulfatase A
MPTLLGLAGLPVPEKPVLDGRDLGPLLRGETETMPERNLFIQSHRGNAPVRYHHVAVRNQQWKLVHASGFSRESLEKPPQFELFDMVRDPFETTSVAAQHPDMVTSMRAAYDQWFDDVSSTRPDNYAPPRIVIDAARENPVVLTRQDWRRTRAGGWGDEGFWLVRIEQPTILTLNCRLLDDRPSEQIQLLINGQPRATTSTDENGRQGTFRDIRLHPGDYEMTAVARHNDRTEGVFQIEVRSARVQSGR